MSKPPPKLQSAHLDWNPHVWINAELAHHAREQRAPNYPRLIAMAEAAIQDLPCDQMQWDELVPSILEELGNYPRIWKALIQADETSRRIEPLLRRFEVQEIKNDRDIMYLAIRADPSCCAHLGEELCRDKSFILSLLKADPKIVPLLPKQVFEEGPEVLENLLPVLFREVSFSTEAASDFAKELMELIPSPDEFIYRVWIPSGGPLNARILFLLHPSMRVPRRIWEAVAKHCSREDYLIHSFQYAPVYLRADYRWMSRMIEERPTIYVTATEEVQQAIRRQVEAYAPFHFFLGHIVEDKQLRVGDYNYLIADYLGVSRLRQALAYQFSKPR